MFRRFFTQSRPDNRILDIMKTGSDSEIIKTIKSAPKPALNATDDQGNTPLHLAVQQRKQAWVTALLKKKANPDIKNINSETPLHIAIKTRYWTIAKQLKQAGARLDICAFNGNAIHYLAQEGATNLIRDWLTPLNASQQSTLLTQTDDFGQTPLHAAARHPQTVVIKCLLSFCSMAKLLNTYDKTEFASTPLHTAVYHNQLENVKALVKAGAATELPNAQNLTPLMLAEQRSQTMSINYTPIIAHLKGESDEQDEDELENIREEEKTTTSRLSARIVKPKSEKDEEDCDTNSDETDSSRTSAIESETHSFMDAAFEEETEKEEREEKEGEEEGTAESHYVDKMPAKQPPAQMSIQHPPAQAPQWQTIDGKALRIKQTCLGKGHFGAVFMGKWHGHDVAVKVVKTQNIKDTNTLNQAVQDLEDEAAIHAQLNSPAAVRFFGFTKQPRITLVMEYCDQGSLTALLSSQQPLSFKQLQRLAKDIAQGLQHLHDKGILHRDLAPRNIMLVSSHGKYSYRAKIADFGLSRFKRHFKLGVSSIVPLDCTAPECLNSQSPPTEKSDMFSYGGILFALTTRQKPFDELLKDHSPREVTEEIQKGYRSPYPQGKKPPSHWQIITQQCWDGDPNCRPTAREAYQFFKRYSADTTNTTTTTTTNTNTTTTTDNQKAPPNLTLGQ